MMNETVRRLGVTLTPKCLDQQECQDSNGLLSLGALGVASLGRRQDWRACREASYFYVACVFIWRMGRMPYGSEAPPPPCCPWGCPAEPVMRILSPVKVLFLPFAFLSLHLSIWGPLHLPPEVRCVFEEYGTTFFHFLRERAGKASRLLTCVSSYSVPIGPPGHSGKLQVGVAGGGGDPPGR